jgi:Protein of unknown function (DUF1236)
MTMKKASFALLAVAGLLTAGDCTSAQAVDEADSALERNAIRAAILQQRTAPIANTHFRFIAGNVAPPGVALQALPAEIARTHPGWRGYMYFLGGDQIVIVEPVSLRIVSVMPA